MTNTSFGADYVSNLPTYNQVLKDGLHDPYSGSLFYPLKQLSSKKKGTRMEQLVEDIFKAEDNDVQPAGNKDWDRLINGSKVEIKGSFLWAESSEFRWQQIRVNQGYEYILFLAFYPDRLDMFWADKATIAQKVAFQAPDGSWPHNQHGGKHVKHADTFYIEGHPKDFDWFNTLDTAPFLLP